VARRGELRSCGVPVTGIDHLALPTDDAERLAAFYASLGFEVHGLDEWRAKQASIFSIRCGAQKINVHPENLKSVRGHPAYLRGDTAEAGCGDLCVVWEGGIDSLLEMLEREDVATIEGPVPRLGGRGAETVGISVYVRDPDHNLLEFISYDPQDVTRYGDAGPAM
jgi:catechol 2,3-dioxygenase-like lactoylglutathione lyase family enzyme